METLRIDILNPKVKSLLKNLADLKLIRIKKDKSNEDLKEIVKKLRLYSNEKPSFEEITSEVEEVRKSRYEG